ncbi:MAG: YHYH protein [Bacteroidota bacterium]|nr:YHYH protein [Bacteroidota bacterium]MDX5431149.1 YHYH protein [Bacteroidota bacterium]MDX5469896.1 YHYH protein [Bacteroidota bacterium]
MTLTSCKKNEVTENPTVDPPRDSVDITKLPFGGIAPTNILIRNLGNPKPDLLSLWLCGLPSNGAGNSNAKDWTNSDGTWDYTKKPQVQGNVTWNSQFSVSLDGNGKRIISGNALPSHPTGVFPITPGSLAYKYDGNPNIISEHVVYYELPALPQVAAAPSCVPFGPSGISLSGSAIYHGASTLGNDAAAHEMLDRFGGHTDGTERYHYHFPADDLMDHIHPHESGHSALMGYMLDGFGIYGPYCEHGELLSSKDLDECHGHTHPVLWDGQMINLYHYHWTYDFPYNLGCFKGTPQ